MHAAALDDLVKTHPIVLFVKGNRTAPRCGFSARVFELIAGHLHDWHEVDVLGPPDHREGIKAWSDWPTFPQVWAHGELVGGADIVEELHRRGTLADALFAPAPALTVTPCAQSAIRAALGEVDVPVRLEVSATHALTLSLDPPATAGDALLTVGDVRFLLDPPSASHLAGKVLDSAPGPKIIVRPATVNQLTVQAYDAWQDRPHQLIDVRTLWEWNAAKLDDAILLEDRGADWLIALPRDTTLVFLCHHGIRSQHAASWALEQGFAEVHNLVGGIDAWSLQIDPSVPRY